MQEKLSQIKMTVMPAIESAKTLADLDAIRVNVVGKSGSLTALMKELGGLSIEEKKTFGSQVNLFKGEVMKAIEEKKNVIKQIG